MKFVEKIQNYINCNRKKVSEYILILAIVGVALVFIGGMLDKDGEEKVISTQEVDKKSDDMAEDLKKILSTIKGVGEVNVYITFYDTKEEVYVRDEKRTISENEQEYEHNIVMSDVDGNKQPIKSKEVNPRPKGVIIVAEGGDKSHICDGIIKGVKSVTGLSEYQIQVYPLK